MSPGTTQSRAKRAKVVPGLTKDTYYFRGGERIFLGHEEGSTATPVPAAPTLYHSPRGGFRSTSFDGWTTATRPLLSVQRALRCGPACVAAGVRLHSPCWPLRSLHMDTLLVAQVLLLLYCGISSSIPLAPRPATAPSFSFNPLGLLACSR